MKEFSFWLITDTHFFKNSLGAWGEGYDEFMTMEQKCFAETETIDRAIIKFLSEDQSADTVLIAGDLSFNGEKESHEEFSKLLGQLKESGKKIFVVTAGHDCAPHPFCFPGSVQKQPAEGVKFDELLDYYHDFGYDQAIAFNREHLSYVAQLSEGVRLLVLCNDTAQGRAQEYDDEFYGWIIEQCQQAQRDGQLMLAMEHYPVIAGQPVLQLIGDARQKGARRLIDTLADNGVHLIFTGHMHNQSINLEHSTNGSKFYDVCTGSAIGCPAFMRLCTVKDEKTVEITSRPIPDFEWDTGGRSCAEYMQSVFDAMINTCITGLRDNPAKTLRKLGVKGVENKKTLLKLVGKVGKFLNEATCGRICRVLCIKCEPEIKNDLFLPLASDLARYTFCGDQPYTDQTPQGKTLLRVFKRFNFLSKKLHGSQGEPVDLYEMLKHTAGNYGMSDYNATLILE